MTEDLSEYHTEAAATAAIMATYGGIESPIEVSGEVEDGIVAVYHPPGWTISNIDQTKFLPAPSRSLGNVVAYDANSFLIACLQRRQGDRPAVVYADSTPDSPAITAVLDDDFGGALPVIVTDADSDGNQPVRLARPAMTGWRQHRVSLGFRLAPEWIAWKAFDNRALPQRTFAEFVEEHAGEFVSPSAATMLEVARNIDVHRTAKVRSVVRLESDAVQFAYEESDSKGGGGHIEIPTRFRIGIQVYLGGDRFEFEVLLRYSLADGAVTFTYKLFRPEKVLDAIFGEFVSAIGAGTEALGWERPDEWLVQGPAPKERRRRSDE